MILPWVVIGLVLLFGFVVAFGAPYVPSLRKEVEAAFDELYPVDKDDFVVDLGSGDGVVLLSATRRGARGLGYEINPLLVLISCLRLRGAARIRLKNMWADDVPDETTLVYIFSVTRDSSRLAGFLQQQADRLGRPLTVMTFGVGLKGCTPKKVRNGHSLYVMLPASAIQP